jgi:D-sedoheptulose 7-phosphate isomerase
VHGTSRSTAIESAFQMNSSHDSSVTEYFTRSVRVLQNAAEDRALHRTIDGIADVIERALRSGKKIMLAGNGGSAADAQHIAAEFVSRFKFDRSPLAAIALTTDTSILTAIGNDYGYEQVFVRQLLGLGQAGDVFIALSTSGRSPSILAALKTAKDMSVKAVGFTGSHDNPMRSLCDICLDAPSDETALIQQIHMVAAHAICGLVERRMFSKPEQPAKSC